MTTKTKKILVAILLSLLFCGIVVLGLFEFVISYVKPNNYGAALPIIDKINKSSAFTTDCKKTIYTVELDEDVDINAVKSAINARLQKGYGYYGAKLDFDKATNELTITLPNNARITSNGEVNVEIDDNGNITVISDTKSILDSITATGKLEILDSSSYSESSVVLTEEHFKRASVKTYVNGTNTWYICQVRLTAEGTKIADDKFTIGSTYYYSVDDSVQNIAVYTNTGTFQLYSYDSAESYKLASYVKTGSLGATLTWQDSEEITNNAGWVYLLIFGLVVLASFVYAAIRYKWLSVVPIVTQLGAIVIYVLFAGLAYSEMFNVAAAIGTFIVYAFMSFFSWITLERISKRMADNKTYTWARHMAFEKKVSIFSLICHGALLVLGIVLWVIPSVVTAPLGCVFVYGAVLSFVATFCLNRLFTYMLSPYYENVGRKAKVNK